MELKVKINEADLMNRIIKHTKFLGYVKNVKDKGFENVKLFNMVAGNVRQDVISFRSDFSYVYDI